AAREVIAELPETGAGTPEEIQAAITAQNQRIDELDTRLAALTEQVEAAPQPAPSPATEAAPEPAPAAAPETAPEPAPAQPEAQPQPAPDLGPLEDSIAALQSRLDEQQAKLDELAARPEIDEAQIAELRDLADSASATRDEIEAAAADARARIDAVQADADAASERAQAVASFASLRSALESGADRSAALGDLQAAGVQVPEALSAAEIPTLDALQAEFDPAARAALRASLQSQSTGGLGAVGNFLRVQSGARSVEPRAGGDPDAVLSRADAAVGAGDIQRALDELAALPEAGQAAMEEWTARARAYLAAGAALDDVSGSLN
ncbi:MAG: hypothetical protein Q4F71_12440, partial [Paracoccus sp. (in: a-proteobacteria)]|nr:hypothetical protein [Paracoccus sp. (in: a-proteobacteria)]